MAVYTHCCRAQPLRQLGVLVFNIYAQIQPFELTLTYTQQPLQFTNRWRQQQNVIRIKNN